MNFTPVSATPSTSFNYAPMPFQRQFVSAQRRYDNMRVRENEIQQRLCRECGRIVHGDDLAFQHHIVSHEAAFICYQIYHFEKGTTLPKNYHGQSKAKYTKDKSVASGSPKKSARDLARKQMKQPIIKKRKLTESPSSSQREKSRLQSTSSKTSKKDDLSFIDDKPFKKELNLSEDDSYASNVTDSDQEEVDLPVDDDEMKKYLEFAV